MASIKASRACQQEARVSRSVLTVVVPLLALTYSGALAPGSPPTGTPELADLPTQPSSQVPGPSAASPASDLPIGNYSAVLADLQRQLGTWWNPINLTIPAGIFYVTQPLTPDVRAQSSNTVSISGQGPDKTILDCQGNTRIAISVSGVSAILLADLTVRNCRPSSAELQRSLVSGDRLRGSVSLQASNNITVTRCVFQGNGAREVTVGAGLTLSGLDAVLSASVRITDSLFLDNTAWNGGGIFTTKLTGSLLIANCTFQNNTAGTDGGGISVARQTGPVEIRNCIFKGNRASQFNSTGGQGGSVALAVLTAPAEIRSCTCTGNSAGEVILCTGNFAGQGAGGCIGVENSTSSLVIADSIMQANTADSYGGHIYMNTTLNVTVANTVFSNGSTKVGGAVCAFYGKTALFTDCTFTANNGSLGGGALYFESFQRDANISINRCNHTANTGEFGGGLCIQDSAGNTYLTDNTFEANQADTGGGFFLQELKGSTEIRRCAVLNNTANYNGGGFSLVLSNALLLQDSIVQGNRARGSACEGASSSNNTGSPVFRNVTWLDNGIQTFPAFGSCLNVTDTFSQPPPPPLRASLPPTSRDAPVTTESTSKNNLPLIVGAVVGGVAGVGLLAGLVAFLVIRKRRAHASPETRAKPGGSEKSGDMHGGVLTSHSSEVITDEYTTTVVVTPAQGTLDTKPAAAAGTAAATGTPTETATGIVSMTDSTRQPASQSKTIVQSAPSATGASPVTITELSGQQMSGAPSGPQSVIEGSKTLAMELSAVSSMDSYAVYQRELLQRLKISWDSLKVGRVIGRGGFGIVYQAKWQATDVAVKTFELVSAKGREELQREALAMREISHPYIAHIFGLVDEGPHCALVMKYYKGGTVAQLINGYEYAGVPYSYRLQLGLQVATGMSALHERKMLHGDLKTSNLLIERDGNRLTSIITDFGLSVFAGESLSTAALTIHISPPEVLRDPRAPRTQPGDVYAYAIVLLEIVSGTRVYRGMTEQAIVKFVLAGKRPPIPANVPEEVRRLIQACWAEDPDARPSFKDVVQALEADTEGATVTQATHTLPEISNTASYRPTTIEWPYKKA